MRFPLPTAGVLRPAYIRRVAGVLELHEGTVGRLDLAHRILAELVDDGWRPPDYLEGILTVTAYAGDALCERHGFGSRALPAKLRVARGDVELLVCVDHAGLAAFDLCAGAS